MGADIPLELDGHSAQALRKTYSDFQKLSDSVFKDIYHSTLLSTVIRLEREGYRSGMFDRMKDTLYEYKGARMRRQLAVI